MSNKDFTSGIKIILYQEKEQSQMTSFLRDKFSGHGFPRVVKHGSRVRKVIWCLVSLMATLYLVANFYILIQEYLNYEKKVEIQMISLDKAEFPAVSICNQNSISKVKAKESLEQKWRKFISTERVLSSLADSNVHCYGAQQTLFHLWSANESTLEKVEKGIMEDKYLSRDKRSALRKLAKQKKGPENETSAETPWPENDVEKTSERSSEYVNFRPEYNSSLRNFENTLRAENAGDNMCFTTTGEQCNFPSYVDDKLYLGCIKRDEDPQPWCYTTSYSKRNGTCSEDCLVDTQGSSCLTFNGFTCKFPFMYKGKEHNECITEGDELFQHWCYTNSTAVLWDHCGATCKKENGCKTRSGQYCSFPFFYKGYTKTACTMDNWFRPWCFTDLEKTWSECGPDCPVESESDHKCREPYIPREMEGKMRCCSPRICIGLMSSSFFGSNNQAQPKEKKQDIFMDLLRSDSGDLSDFISMYAPSIEDLSQYSMDLDHSIESCSMNGKPCDKSTD